MKTPNYTNDQPKYAKVFPTAFKGLPLRMTKTRPMAWKPAKDSLHEYIETTASPLWLTVTLCAAVVLMIVAQILMKL